MRDYSKISGSFWTGRTGKELRGDMQAQIIALYLMSSPHATMIGVFHCPLIYIAHETGSTIEGASKGLQRLCEGGFCTYDEESEMVWVHEMAKFQVCDQLVAKDKRQKGIEKQYLELPKGLIKQGFYARYKDAFLLPKERESSKPLTSPLQAPCKPGAGAGAGAGAGTEIKPDAIAAVVPIGLDLPSWQKWMEYRKSIKKPIKQFSVTAAQRKLAGFGDLQSAVVEQSIANGWQGLFPLNTRKSVISSPIMAGAV